MRVASLHKLCSAMRELADTRVSNCMQQFAWKQCDELDGQKRCDLINVCVVAFAFPCAGTCNEPPLPRRKKCPELAYKTHEFISCDQPAAGMPTANFRNAINAASRARVRRVKRFGGQWVDNLLRHLSSISYYNFVFTMVII